jgi:hypothetical protein
LPAQPGQPQIEGKAPAELPQQQPAPARAIRLQPALPAQPLPAQPLPAQRLPAQPGQPQIEGKAPAELPQQQPAPARAIQIPAQKVQIAPLPAVAQQIAPANGPAGTAVPPVVLIDGKDENFAVQYAGAARVRARGVSAEGAPEEAISVEVQASLEPNLTWQGSPEVRVKRVVDSAGQSLSLLVAESPMNVGRALNAGGFHRVIPLSFGKGEKPAQSLAELTGVICGNIQTQPRVLMAADDILNAGGKTIKGAEGGVLKIHEVKKIGEDRVSIRYEFDPPAQAPPPPPQGQIGIPIQVQPLPAPLPAPAPGKQGAAPPPANRPAAVAQLQAQVQVNQVIVGGLRGRQAGVNGLELHDEDDQPMAIVGTQFRTTRDANGLRREVTVTYQVPKGKSAKRFVYIASAYAAIEIPFTLRNVPLP